VVEMPASVSPSPAASREPISSQRNNLKLTFPVDSGAVVEQGFVILSGRSLAIYHARQGSGRTPFAVPFMWRRQLCFSQIAD
jgi:hypothetical protein